MQDRPGSLQICTKSEGLQQFPTDPIFSENFISHFRTKRRKSRLKLRIQETGAASSTFTQSIDSRYRLSESHSKLTIHNETNQRERDYLLYTTCSTHSWAYYLFPLFLFPVFRYCVTIFLMLILLFLTIQYWITIFLLSRLTTIGVSLF